MGTPCPTEGLVECSSIGLTNFPTFSRPAVKIKFGYDSDFLTDFFLLLQHLASAQLAARRDRCCVRRCIPRPISECSDYAVPRSRGACCLLFSAGHSSCPPTPSFCRSLLLRAMKRSTREDRTSDAGDQRPASRHRAEHRAEGPQVRSQFLLCMLPLQGFRTHDACTAASDARMSVGALQFKRRQGRGVASAAVSSLVVN